jgi:RNA polymerase sigma-70 factor (sigma-E family)
MALFRARLPQEAADYASAALPRVLATAYRLTGNRSDAEDLAHDTLTTVLAKWERVRQADSLDAYVRTMLVNRFLSMKRHSSHEVVSLAPLDPRRVAPSSRDDWNPDHDMMWAMLAKLPARQRAVLVLRYYEDLPDDTIAAILGCAPATVRSLAFRALGALRLSASDELTWERIGQAH